LTVPLDFPGSFAILLSYQSIKGGSRMKRKLVFGLVLALLLVSASGVFAAGEQKSKEFPWMASYNKPGQFNVYAAVGFYGYGIDINAGPEIIFAKFDPAGIPLSLGGTVRGLVGFSSFFGISWIDWAIAPMVTLHWGVDFGSIWKFDWYIGLGLGISGTTGTFYNYSGVGFGFASSDGVAWHFSDSFALIFDYAYTYYMSSAGIGIKLAL
jgi:hypothetical protein